MRFESAADKAFRGVYPVPISSPEPGRPMEISFGPLIRALVLDIEKGTPVAVVSARFHDSLAGLVLRVAERARSAHGTDTVSLAGGVFLNRRLLERTEKRLEAKEFRIFRPVLYSPNDESLSLGQIARGLTILKTGGS